MSGTGRHREAQNPEAFLPLRPADVMILLVLADGERHGYRLVHDIAARSGGRVRLEAGNLYRSLRRLRQWGLLAESARRPAEDLDDERRRYYCLTPLGRRVLGAEARRLRSLVRAAEALDLLGDLGPA